MQVETSLITHPSFSALAISPPGLFSKEIVYEALEVKSVEVRLMTSVITRCAIDIGSKVSR